MARSLVGRRVAIVLVAAVVALGVWALATEAFGVNLESPGYGSTPAQTIEVVWVLVVPIVVGLAGWGLLAVLQRVSPTRGRRMWTVIAAAVLLLSLLVTVTGAGVSVGSRVTSACLHVAVGAILILGLSIVD
jgi:hypothetical protein